MHLFYDPHIEPTHTEFVLNEEESGHACRVLRLKNGDKVYLLNGRGNRFLCEISEAHPKKCTVSILEVTTEPHQDLNLHLAIAPTKNMERIEWLIEKITELGIDQITFLSCRNNERKQVKLDRLQRILVSAMKQSQRTYLPVLDDLTDFKSFVKSHPNGLIAHCSDGEKLPVQLLLESTEGPVLIGPEGDFTNDEIKAALENGYKSISLGKNRLRTETAGLLVTVAMVLSKKGKA